MTSKTKANHYKVWDTEVDLTLDSLPSDEYMAEMQEGTNYPTHGFFDTPQGKLHYRQYIPGIDGSNEDTKVGREAKAIRAVCIWQHGIAAHSGMSCKISDDDDDTNEYKYTNMGLLSRKLLSQDIALYAPDLLGHGFSEGQRFYIPGGNYKINLDHLENFTRFIHGQHPGIPLFIMGDSYGGCLSLHLAKRFQLHPDTAPDTFKGICINAPAIMGDFPPAPVTFVLKNILAPIIPTSTPFFMPHPIPPERIWKNEKVRMEHSSEQTRAMKLSAGAIPFCLGTASGLVDALQDCVSTVIPGFSVPFSVCHGTDDWGVPVKGTEYLVETAVTNEEERRVNIIDGALHDLLGDPEVMHDVVDSHLLFMEERIKA